MSDFVVVMTDSAFDDCLLEAEILAKAGAEVRKYQTYDPKIVLELAKDADGILCDYAPINRVVIEGLTKAKGIVVTGVGYDNVDIVAATERRIVVSNDPEYMTYEVPEHTIALILALARKIVPANVGSKRGEWNKFGEKYWNKVGPIFHLDGKTLGIIGFGRIGRKVARRMLGFEMKLLSYDPYVSESVMREHGVTKADLKTVLKESDFISIHSYLTPETFHLIGDREFDLMKPTAILVNTSRGKIIDQKALVKALATHRIAGAGLDVLEREPPDLGEEILNLDNAIITPHMAAFSEKVQTTIRKLAAEEMARILRGEPPKYVLNPEVLKPRPIE
jgi:D-3-phosphoglycerate dehydrogenase / 2-oxoglutarate reductase